MKRLHIVCAAALAGSSPALAHHSSAAYDMTRQVTIEGTVAALSWSNPHIMMMLETKNPDGSPFLQEIEVMSVAQARGLGLRREAISPGARVVVSASPSRRGGAGIRPRGHDERRRPDAAQQFRRLQRRAACCGSSRSGREMGSERRQLSQGGGGWGRCARQ